MNTCDVFPADSKFLQSPLWEKVYRAEGLETIRIGNAFFVERKTSFFGKYWYSPRGPFFDGVISVDRVQGLFTSVLTQAKKHGVIWIRIDVRTPLEMKLLRQIFGTKMFLHSPHDMQPKTVLDVDIHGTEEDILSRMKSKTRYNIRLAKKKNVNVFVDYELRHVEDFYSLIATTSDRAGIVSHPKSHYEAIFHSIPSEYVSLYCASYEGNIIAAAIIIFYNGTALYLHGGSSNEFRGVMAPYLLHFQVMLDAKARGCNIYSFGGIDTPGVSVKNQLAGITRFKMGFSPYSKVVSTVGSYDIVLFPFRYVIYRLLRNIFVLKMWIVKCFWMVWRYLLP